MGVLLAFSNKDFSSVINIDISLQITVIKLVYEVAITKYSLHKATKAEEMDAKYTGGIKAKSTTHTEKFQQGYG